MNTKNNQRAKETNERIVRAVFHAMTQEHKSIARITVREVCQRAEINRSTFYAHFQDVYDVMEQVEKTMAKGLTERFLTTLDQGGTLAECFISLFDYIQEYRGFYRVYFQESNQTGVIGIAWELVQDRMKDITFLDFGYRSEEEMAYHREFALYGMTAMIRHWIIERDCQESPREMLDMMLRQNKSAEIVLSLLGEPAQTKAHRRQKK